MAGFFEWFTHLENSKVFALLLFFTVFCLILVYLFSSKKRSQRLESYKYIPFDDEDEDSSEKDLKDKVNRDE